MRLRSCPGSQVTVEQTLRPNLRNMPTYDHRDRTLTSLHSIGWGWRDVNSEVSELAHFGHYFLVDHPSSCEVKDPIEDMPVTAFARIHSSIHARVRRAHLWPRNLLGQQGLPLKRLRQRTACPLCVHRLWAAVEYQLENEGTGGQPRLLGLDRTHMCGLTASTLSPRS